MNLSNGNYEKLVEQITDLVLSKIGDDAYCPTFCRADVERIVDAGASRIGIVLGETATAHDWAALIDHTLLKPEASESDIKTLCNEAIQFGFASVCVNPSWVKKASEYLQGSNVPVCTVIGFPLGATLSDVKAYEARRAIFNGAREVDMVINIGALKSGDDCAVEDDIRAVAEAAHEHCLLTMKRCGHASLRKTPVRTSLRRPRDFRKAEQRCTMLRSCGGRSEARW